MKLYLHSFKSDEIKRQSDVFPGLNAFKKKKMFEYKVHEVCIKYASQKNVQSNFFEMIDIFFNELEIFT